MLQSRVILAYMPKASNPDIVAGCIRKVGRSLSSDVIRTRFLNIHPKFVDDDDILRFELTILSKNHSRNQAGASARKRSESALGIAC